MAARTQEPTLVAAPLGAGDLMVLVRTSLPAPGSAEPVGTLGSAGPLGRRCTKTVAAALPGRCNAVASPSLTRGYAACTDYVSVSQEGRS